VNTIKGAKRRIPPLKEGKATQVVVVSLDMVSQMDQTRIIPYFERVQKITKGELPGNRP
jgi:hypothetical protein